MLRSNSDEERRVNDLASELLIPAEVVKASLPELPVVATRSRNWRSMPTSLSSRQPFDLQFGETIGLVNASVVLFDGDADSLEVVEDTVDGARYRRQLLAEGSRSFARLSATLGRR